MKLYLSVGHPERALVDPDANAGSGEELHEGFQLRACGIAVGMAAERHLLDGVD